MFRTNDTGSITTAFVLILPALLVGGAVALDLLMLNVHRSHVQAQADFSALEAVRFVSDEDQAFAQATESVALNDQFVARALTRQQVTLGRYHDGVFVPKVAGGPRSNAAQVQAVSDSFMSVSALLGRGRDSVIQRDAVAAVHDSVSFALSNCLVSLNLFNGILRPFLGAETDVICSDGVLRLKVDALLETLSADLDAPMTYGEVLNSDIALNTLWSAALGVSVDAPQGSVRLGDLIHLDDADRRTRLGVRLPGGTVSGSDLIMGSLELFGEHAVDLDLKADLGPLAQVPISLTVVEPRRIVTNVEPGSPEAYAETAQIRLGVNGLDLLGLVRLSLELEIARASARLSDEATMCTPGDDSEVVVFNPVTAGLLELKVELSVLGLTISDTIDLVDTGPLRVGFSADDVAQQRSKEFSPRLEGVLDDTADEVVGLLDQLPLSGLTRPLGGLLGGVVGAVSPLDELLGAIVHDFVGLAIAPATLTVYDAECSIRLVQ